MIAFWTGAFIAVIGSVARTILRENPEFVSARNRAIDIIQDRDQDPISLYVNSI